MPLIASLAVSPGLFICGWLVLGVAVGSFLNVVIYRLPLMLDRQWREQCAELNASAPGESSPATRAPERFDLVEPPSACPLLQDPAQGARQHPAPIRLMLGGRCAHCGKPIAIRYPLVEALTGILSAAVAWKFGFGWPAFAAIVLTWFLIALAFIDIDHQLLPDSLTLPLLWGGLFVSLWGPASAATIPIDLRSSVIGAMAGYLSLWSVYHLYRLVTGKEGMGYGDFKLLAALGAWLGPKMLLPVILLAAPIGAVVGAALLGLRGRDRSTPIAFGPFLAASGWVVLMFGRALLDYLGLFIGQR